MAKATLPVMGVIVALPTGPGFIYPAMAATLSLSLSLSLSLASNSMVRRG